MQHKSNCKVLNTAMQKRKTFMKMPDILGLAAKKEGKRDK